MARFEVTYKCPIPECRHRDTIILVVPSKAKAWKTTSAPCPEHKLSGDMKAAKVVEMKSWTGYPCCSSKLSQESGTQARRKKQPQSKTFIISSLGKPIICSGIHFKYTTSSWRRFVIVLTIRTLILLMMSISIMGVQLLWKKSLKQGIIEPVSVTSRIRRNGDAFLMSTV